MLCWSCEVMSKSFTRSSYQRASDVTDGTHRGRYRTRSGRANSACHFLDRPHKAARIGKIVDLGCATNGRISRPMSLEDQGVQRIQPHRRRRVRTRHSSALRNAVIGGEPITNRGQSRCVPLQTRTCVLSGGLDQLIPRRYPRRQGTTRQRPCPRFVMGSITLVRCC
jgi:hypothetical protein